MSGSYVVVSTRLDTVDEKGRRTKHYRGDTITGLSEADVDRFKSAGAIAAPSNDEAKAAKADPAEPNPAETSAPADDTSVPQASDIVASVNAGAAPAQDPEPVTPEATVPQASDIVAQGNSGVGQLKRPVKAATVDAWRTYAVESGQMTEDEAKAHTRDQLRDALK